MLLLNNLYPTDSGWRENKKGLITFADLVRQEKLWPSAEKLSRSDGLELHTICLFLKSEKSRKQMGMGAAIVQENHDANTKSTNREL